MTLTGKIDGTQVTFRLVREEGRRTVWEAEFPENLSGQYIVWLTAVDDAGNETSTCRYIVTIDLENLCIHIIPAPVYTLEDTAPDYRLEQINQGYRLEPGKEQYEINDAEITEYWLKPVYPDCSIDLGVRI